MRIAIVTVALFLPALLYAGNVRKVVANESSVTPIHTAIGLSTLLQFDSRPSSAIVGDQDAFKVEYLGQSLSIKPLLPNAKTNLFVFLEYDRFNFTLVSGPKTSADYIVQVMRKQDRRAPEVHIAGETPLRVFPATTLNSQAVSKESSRRGVTLRVLSIEWPQSDSSLIVHFQIVFGPKQKTSVSTADIALSAQQGSGAVPIQSVYIDAPTPHKKYRVLTGTLVLRQEALSALPLAMSLRTSLLRKPLTVIFDWKPRK